MQKKYPVTQYGSTVNRLLAEIPKGLTLMVAKLQNYVKTILEKLCGEYQILQCGDLYAARHVVA